MSPPGQAEHRVLPRDLGRRFVFPSKVMAPLRAEGYEVISAQYGLNSNVEDVAAAMRYFGQVQQPDHPGRPLLRRRGHHRPAGTDDRVVGLVYIAALGPDETETSQGQQDKFPVARQAFTQAVVADGRVWMKPSAIGCFCGDLPEEEQKIVWSDGQPPGRDLVRPQRPRAWPGEPSRPGTHRGQQRPVRPPRTRAGRGQAAMGAATYDIDSSHDPHALPTPTTSSTSSAPPPHSILASGSSHGSQAEHCVRPCGIWADGSSGFSKVIPPLRAEGYPGDVRPVRPRLQRRGTSLGDGPHLRAGSAAQSSWSGTPTAAVSSPPRVRTMTASPGWCTSARSPRMRPRPRRVSRTSSRPRRSSPRSTSPTGVCG